MNTHTTQQNVDSHIVDMFSVQHSIQFPSQNNSVYNPPRESLSQPFFCSQETRDISSLKEQKEKEDSILCSVAQISTDQEQEFSLQGQKVEQKKRKISENEEDKNKAKKMSRQGDSFAIGGVEPQGCTVLTEQRQPKPKTKQQAIESITNRIAKRLKEAIKIIQSESISDGESELIFKAFEEWLI